MAQKGGVRVTLGLLDSVVPISIPLRRSKKPRAAKRPKRKREKRGVPSILKRAATDNARRNRLFALFWRMLRGVTFKHGHVDILLGFEDPAATGEALGTVQAILGTIPSLRRFLTVTGDFSGRALEIDGTIILRFRPIYHLWLGLKAGWVVIAPPFVFPQSHRAAGARPAAPAS